MTFFRSCCHIFMISALLATSGIACATFTPSGPVSARAYELSQGGSEHVDWDWVLRTADACDMGELHRCRETAQLVASYTGNVDFALGLLHEMCERGSSEEDWGACKDLGELYMGEWAWSGLPDPPIGPYKDLGKSWSFYEKSCENGFGEACQKLGSMMVEISACFEDKLETYCSKLKEKYGDWHPPGELTAARERSYNKKGCNLGNPWCCQALASDAESDGDEDEAEHYSQREQEEFARMERESQELQQQQAEEQERRRAEREADDAAFEETMTTVIDSTAVLVENVARNATSPVTPPPRTRRTAPPASSPVPTRTGTQGASGTDNAATTSTAGGGAPRPAEGKSEAASATKTAEDDTICRCSNHCIRELEKRRSNQCGDPNGLTYRIDNTCNHGVKGFYFVETPGSTPSRDGIDLGPGAAFGTYVCHCTDKSWWLVTHQEDPDRCLSICKEYGSTRVTARPERPGSGGNSAAGGKKTMGIPNSSRLPDWGSSGREGIDLQSRCGARQDGTKPLIVKFYNRYPHKVRMKIRIFYTEPSLMEAIVNIDLNHGENPEIQLDQSQIHCRSGNSGGFYSRVLKLEPI